MFKRPIEVKVDAQDTVIDHKVTIAPYSVFAAHKLLDEVEAKVAALILIAAVASTTSSIIVHIAKTKIK